jgi:hypothetical protein
MVFSKKQEEVAYIKPANIVETTISIKGTSPLVQNKFSEKARKQMMDAMTQTKAEKKTKAQREPRNFDTEFQQAQHISEDGWPGIPCVAFRASMVDACRLIGIPMTKAKMAIFVLPDGIDAAEGTPLVKVYSGMPPEKHTGLVRLESGVADIRCRPMWRSWACKVKLQYDADLITGESIINLLDRAGKQCGIGEGRAFSKNSVGQGWGAFEVVQDISDELTPKRKRKYA